MSWNNRIFKHTTEHGVFYGIHETYYDQNGNVEGFTEESIIGLFDSIVDLKGSLLLMQTDIERYPEILDYNELDTDKHVGLPLRATDGKTIEDWFSQCGEPWAKEALLWTDEKDLNTIAYSPSDALQKAFKWDETHHDKEVWRKIWENLVY